MTEVKKIAAKHYQIGDPVEIVVSEDLHHWTHDWTRIPLWIAGVNWCPIDGVTYTVTDKWPLPILDYRGHLTDGFQPYHLGLAVARELEAREGEAQ